VRQIDGILHDVVLVIEVRLDIDRGISHE